MNMNFISITSIDVIFFDFDGVLTNNKVYLNQNGDESVRCNRSDGLAFDVIRKLGLPVYILSSEKNKIVSMRAKKLKIEALQCIENKRDYLSFFSKKNKFNLDRAMYVGNDLNDFFAMQLCGYRVCPQDSHNKIKNISNIVLSANGGDGVVRELVENVFEIDFLKTLY